MSESQRRLNAHDAEQLAGHLADAASGSRPLAAGLRAAAAETPSRALRQTLGELADSLEAGRTPDNALHEMRSRIPPHLVGLIQAAARTGRFSEALNQMIDHHFAVRELRRTVTSALAYPLLVLGLTLALFAFISIYIVHQFQVIFDDFGLKLPLVTKLLMWCGGVGIWLILGVVAIIALSLLMLRIVLWSNGRLEVWDRVLAKVPIFGPLVQWAGVSEWSRLMGLLIQQQVPLPETLQLAAAGIHNAHVAAVSRRAATLVEQGSSLSQVLAERCHLPAVLIQLIHSGERSMTLGETFLAASDMYAGRVRLRTVVLNAVLPPLLFLFVGFTVSFLLTGLFSPLVTLIRGLS